MSFQGTQARRRANSLTISRTESKAFSKSHELLKKAEEFSAASLRTVVNCRIAVVVLLFRVKPDWLENKKLWVRMEDIIEYQGQPLV